MAKLKEVAKSIRSKNAGPFWMTIDIFSDKEPSYKRLKKSNNLTKEAIGKLYDVESKNIKIFHIDSLNSIKISFPKVPPQGYKYERDMHSGQQFVRMLSLEID